MDCRKEFVVSREIIIFTVDSHLGKKTKLLKQSFVNLLLSLFSTVSAECIRFSELFSAVSTSRKHLFQNTRNVRDFFQKLYACVNWIKFDELFSLTQQLNLLELNQQLQEHKEEVCLYLRNRVSQIHHNNLPVYFKEHNNVHVLDNNYPSFVVDVDHEWDDELLNESSDTPQMVAKYLDLYPCLVFLRPLQGSCVHLDFMSDPELVSADVYGVLCSLTVTVIRRIDHTQYSCSQHHKGESISKHTDYKAPCEEYVTVLPEPTLRQLQQTNSVTDDRDSTLPSQCLVYELNTISDEKFVTFHRRRHEFMKVAKQNNDCLFSSQLSLDELHRFNTINDSIEGDWYKSYRCIAELNPILM